MGRAAVNRTGDFDTGADCIILGLVTPAFLTTPTVFDVPRRDLLGDSLITLFRDELLGLFVFKGDIFVSVICILFTRLPFTTVPASRCFSDMVFFVAFIKRCFLPLPFPLFLGAAFDRMKSFLCRAISTLT